MATVANNGGVRLLPREALIKSGSIDHADWNYRPILGWIQQLRFRLIVSLLPQTTVPRMLEVGYGSGIFMPELSGRCRELYGIDIHPLQEDVARILTSHGVTARLFSSGAETMPFEDGFFDCIVAVSSLEFVNDIDAAGREMARVLRPDGTLVMVMPGHSPLLDFGLKVLTGESANKDYGGRREALMPALSRYFAVEHRRSFPISRSTKGIYSAFNLRKLATERRRIA
jgi:ubiquinone/menaquinone biosynthesis C-methylase UbiE